MIVNILLSPFVLIPCTILIFLPWNGFLRVGLSVVILMLFAIIIVSFSSGDDFGKALLVFFAVLLLAMWIIAATLQLFLRRTITGDWPQFTRLRGDWLFSWAGYALLALCLFLFLAFRMAGSEKAIVLHLALFGIAAASIRETGFAITLALLTSYSLCYPVIVTRAANDAAQDAPHCIYLNQRKTFATSWKHLTFLTMDKGDWSPHAYVIIQSDPRIYGYWSYRQRQFDTTWRSNFANITLTCPTD